MLVFFCFLVAFNAQLIAFDNYINPYDEGIILVGAENILRGHLPYRDFWTMYEPGQFYLASWLFNIFGTQDVVLRAIGFVAKALIVVLSFKLILHFASKMLSLAFSLIVLGLLISMRQDAFPIFLHWHYQ